MSRNCYSFMFSVGIEPCLYRLTTSGLICIDLVLFWSPFLRFYLRSLVMEGTPDKPNGEIGA